MKKLYLHIGLPKTGSSALQTFFARNVDALQDVGINYRRDTTVEQAAKGHISSGNGKILVRWLRPERRCEEFAWPCVRKQFFEEYFSEYDAALISSELLSSIEERELRAFRDMLGSRCDITVIALVRNIYDHCVSTWHQRLKRHGLASELLDFAKSRYHNPQYHVLSSVCHVFGEERVWVLHYDSVRHAIGEAFLKQGLGRSDISGFGTQIPKVNRSLTQEEIKEIQTLNRAHDHDRRSSVAMSNDLIYRQPELERDKTVNVAVYDLLVDRFNKEVEDINERFFDGVPVLSFGNRDRRSG